MLRVAQCDSRRHFFQVSWPQGWDFSFRKAKTEKGRTSELGPHASLRISKHRRMITEDMKERKNPLFPLNPEEGPLPRFFPPFFFSFFFWFSWFPSLPLFCGCIPDFGISAPDSVFSVPSSVSGKKKKEDSLISSSSGDKGRVRVFHWTHIPHCVHPLHTRVPLPPLFFRFFIFFLFISISISWELWCCG